MKLLLLLLEGVIDSHQITDLGSLLKYILCYCSTDQKNLSPDFILYLNTYYVTVQP